MTSTEKVAELRVAMMHAIATAKRDGDPMLAAAFGVWRVLRLVARREVDKIAAILPLEDDQELDELLGLIAGVALELRSDGLNFEDVEDEVSYCRAHGRALLEQIANGDVGLDREQ